MGQGDSHINTEQWLVAPAPAGQHCYVNGTASSCWVEAGIKAGLSQCTNIECLFWNDVTPSGGYVQHWETTVPSADYGQPAAIRIFQASSTTFNISIIDAFACWTGQSTNNTMLMNNSSDSMQTGVELQGSSMASLPPTDFVNNGYLGSNSAWYYEHANGAPIDNSPLSFQVVSYPSSSSTGGDFRGWCSGSNNSCG